VLRQNRGGASVEGRLTLSGRAPASWRNPNRLSLALLNGQPLHVRAALKLLLLVALRLVLLVLLLLLLFRLFFSQPSPVLHPQDIVLNNEEAVQLAMAVFFGITRLL
jgi:hypothetical protein